MFRINSFKSALCAAALCLAVVSAFAQEKGMSCDGNDGWNNDRPTHCVMREQTIPATGGLLTVDGRKNGGVSVKGWQRNEILVRARVQASGNNDAEARALAEQVQIVTGGGNIHAEGPMTGGRDWWSVSFEVFVPQKSDLSLKANNGGISIADVRGRIDFDTRNGGVTLKRLGGAVRGTTTNGGLSIDLEGSRWDGEGMDVRTTNGGVKMSVPEGYSAHLETSTVNGGLSLDFPVTVQGKIGKELSTDLGSGGPPIKVATTNGGVTIKRK